MRLLDDLYAVGEPQVVENHEAALRWYGEAAKHGDKLAAMQRYVDMRDWGMLSPPQPGNGPCENLEYCAAPGYDFRARSSCLGEIKGPKQRRSGPRAMLGEGLTRATLNAAARGQVSSKPYISTAESKSLRKTVVWSSLYSVGSARCSLADGKNGDENAVPLTSGPPS